MTTSWRGIRLLAAACVLLPALAGCGKEKIDRQAEFDNDIDVRWRQNWKWVDADKFFSSGGLFVDSGEPGDPVLDRPHVQPLLKTLREKHGLKWQAVVDKKKTRLAVALVSELPSKGEVEKIRETIKQAQEKFPGEILYKFGHRWMSMDFLTEEDLRWEEEAERKIQARTS